MLAGAAAPARLYNKKKMYNKYSTMAPASVDYKYGGQVADVVAVVAVDLAHLPLLRPCV